MSDLIVIGYPDHDSAQQAYNKALELQGDMVLNLSGLALVTVDQDGKNHVETPGRLVSASAASGALWGALLGILFLVPGVGIILGGAIGALMGKLGQSGVDDVFRSKVKSMLDPGKAAVVIMATKITEDKFAAAMKPFGGEILQTSLSDADEKELASELAG
jgi:uncharacterized membrane protein